MVVVKSKSRTSNLRLKIVCLLWIRTLDSKVGRPTDRLARHLQDERRLSAVALASSPSRIRSTLDAVRRAIDGAVARFRFSSGTQSAYNEQIEAASGGRVSHVQPAPVDR
jgi:hypothetical protein